MSSTDLSDVSIKRFVVVYVLILAASIAMGFVVIYGLDIDANFGFVSFLTPMLAAIDTGTNYAKRHKAQMDKKFAWQVALRLNWVHLLIQIVLSVLGIVLFWPELQALGATVPTFAMICVALLVVLFLSSWPFIRWGLSLGAKSFLKQEERKAK